MDMPVTITAMTYTGSSSNVQTTMVKIGVIKTIVLFAPATTVSKNETPELSFEAYDQFGNKLTKYVDVYGAVGSPLLTLTGVTVTEKTDGTAKFEVAAASTVNKGIANLSVSVINSGKMSQLTINVQDEAKPVRVAVDASVLVKTMEFELLGAEQDFDFGESGGGVLVYDQYDREIDTDDMATLFAAGGKTYTVKLTSSDVAKLTMGLNGGAQGVTQTLTASTDYTTLKAAGLGSATLTVELLENATVVDTASTTLNVVDADDVKSYELEKVSSAIYTSVANGSAAVARDSRYDATPAVYGKTSAGAKVLLEGTPLVGASLTNTNDFVFGSGFTGATSAAYAYDAVKVNATKLDDPAKTSAETTLTVNVLHNGAVRTLTTGITSSTAAPVAASISTSGVGSDDAITLSALVNGDGLDGQYLVDYMPQNGLSATAPFKFRITDQYGSRAMAFAQFRVAKAADGGSVTDIVFDANGQIDAATSLVDGASYWISAITDNGLVKTVKVTTNY
jgi:hypothetical protein